MNEGIEISNKKYSHAIKLAKMKDECGHYVHTRNNILANIKAFFGSSINKSKLSEIFQDIGRTKKRKSASKDLILSTSKDPKKKLTSTGWKKGILDALSELTQYIYKHGKSITIRKGTLYKMIINLNIHMMTHIDSYIF